MLNKTMKNFTGIRHRVAAVIVFRYVVNLFLISDSRVETLSIMQDVLSSPTRGAERKATGASYQSLLEWNIMLVLSRKTSESIIINDNIVVTVVDISGNKVRLGFTAPKEVTIHRKEVYERIQRSQAASDARRTDD